MDLPRKTDAWSLVIHLYERKSLTNARDRTMIQRHLRKDPARVGYCGL